MFQTLRRLLYAYKFCCTSVTKSRTQSYQLVQLKETSIFSVVIYPQNNLAFFKDILNFWKEYLCGGMVVNTYNPALERQKQTDCLKFKANPVVSSRQAT